MKIKSYSTLLTMIIALVTLVSMDTKAGNTYYKTKILVRAHFSSEYYGQPVASVTAHLGVESGANWYSVQDLKLEETNGHFFAKTKLDYDYSSSYDGIFNIKVVYLVRLKNGNSKWTQPENIPVTASMKFYEGCNDPNNQSCLYDGAGDSLLSDWAFDKDADGTFATMLSTYH